MRMLSLTQALTCENATKPRCRCRCGGTLHGGRRFGEAPPLAEFTALANEDPHHAEPPAPRRTRRQGVLFEETA